MEQSEKSDLLYGVSAIASYLGLTEAAVYHLQDPKKQAAEKRVPTFKIGGKVCARKTALKEWLDKLEGRTDG